MTVLRRVRLLALSLAVLAPGCGGSSDDTTTSAVPTPDDAAATETVLGPVTVRVAISPAEPRLSDEPELVLTIDSDDDIEVEPPPFGDQVGGFVVRSFHESTPRVEQGRRVVEQRYRLEPVGTGPHTIRPIEVRFVDTRPGGDGEEHVVTTDPLEVTVSSMLAGEAPTLADLRPPVAPTEIEIERPFPTGPVAAAAALLAALIAWIVWRSTRRASGPVEPERTPSELAEIELRRLLADDPLARGELQTFFVELTLTVRRYIERTTGVRAAEETTEEFLRDMRGHEAFDQNTRERLRSFLEAADLVKFARLSPARDDIAETFRRAQEFVGLPGTLTLDDAGREVAA